MTRLMVLGGGRQQLPLIRRARERDFDVVLVDYLPDAPGRDLATHPHLADALDVDSVTAIAADLGVEGITTMGTDLAVRTMAEASRRLGLPCYLESEPALTATDKDLMATALEAAGVPIPDRVTVRRGDPLPDVHSGVAKPADSQGQRGVSLFDSPAGLHRALEEAWAFSATDRAVVESFERGPEVTINAWIADGRVASLVVNDRVTYNPPPRIGIAFQHVFPSLAAEPWLDRAAVIASQIAAAYAMEQGPIYAQAIIGGNGPVVLEAAARVGGGHEEIMVRRIGGWSPADALIDLSLGRGFMPPVGCCRGGAVVVNFVLADRGTVRGVGELPTADSLLDSGWYVGPGDHLMGMENALGRVGYLVVEGDTRAGALAEADRLYRELDLSSTDGSSLIIEPNAAELNQP